MTTTNVLLPEIRAAMLYSEPDFAAILGIPVHTLENKLAVTDLRLDQLTRLADTLECSVETFAKGYFDLEVVRSRFGSENKIVLPTRYQTAAFSKARTSISLFQFIELNLGKSYSERVLSALQVDRTLLESHDQMVSMQLVIDIANLMKQWGVHPQILEQMGSFSAFTNRHGPIGEFFRDCRTSLEVYDKMIPILGKFFEQNHDYRILSLNRKEVLIEAKTSEVIQETLKVKRFGSTATCEIRKGVAGSFSLYIGQTAKAVLHPRCMHRGDHSCVYHVIFDNQMVGVA